MELSEIEPEPRLATPDDLESLVDLAVEFRDFLAREDPSRDAFRAGLAALLRDPSAEFLVVEGAGYAHCRYRFSAWHEGTEAELEDLFVTASARGRGIGRKLVTAAIERAVVRGCRSIGVQTNERNLEAIALYESCGFYTERARWDGGRQLWLDRALTPG